MTKRRRDHAERRGRSGNPRGLQGNRMAPIDTRYEGLGGWLIIVGLGVVISPVRVAYDVISLYLPILTDGTWEKFTTEGSEFYNPLCETLLIFEMTANAAVFLASLYLIYLFFAKKTPFPKWFIGILVFGFFFVLIDSWAVQQMMPDQPMFDEDTAKEIGRAIVVLVIWVPYLLVSKRVKATFVK